MIFEKISATYKAFIIGMGFLSVSLLVHELGHVIAARLAGCGVWIAELNFITGATGIAENCPPTAMVGIALAGPFAAFIYALWCWESGKDTPIRVAGLLSFMFSVIPSLYPNLAGGDMAKAIQFGFPSQLSWGIFFLVFGYIMLEMFKEIMEKEKPFK